MSVILYLLRQKRILLALVLCIAAYSLVGCSNDDDSGSSSGVATGAVYVRVTVHDDVVENASVLTDPATIRGRTNALGACLLSNLPTGYYIILATLQNYGTGSAAIVVRSDTVQNVDIELIAGVFLEPRAEIYLPSSGITYSYADTLTFYGTVTLFEDSAADTRVVWRSSLDGMLFDTLLDRSASLSFKRTNLSAGRHTIILSAVNPDSLTGVDSIWINVDSFSPQVALLLPLNNSAYIPGDTIVFGAQATDRETPAHDLTAEWRSNVDGLINTTPCDSAGQSRFFKNNLSRGVHWISVHVRDTDGHRLERFRTDTQHAAAPGGPECAHGESRTN